MTLVQDRPALDAPTEDRRTRDTAEAVVTGMAVLALLVACWPVVTMATTAPDLDLLGLTAHVSGMLAGYGVLVLLVLMSRWPVLEHGIGADVLSRWHARTGRVVLGLVLLHAATAVLGWARLAGLSPLAAVRDVLGWPGLPGAAVGTALLVLTAWLSVRSARRRLSWETWHGVHLLAYVAVALAFSHQLAGPDLAAYTPGQVFWALLHTGTFALVVRYRVLAPLSAHRRHRLTVVAVLPEADGVVSVVVQGRHVEELEARPGQFFRWRFLTPGLVRTAHPFSLSAPPVGDRLRLTVKSLGEGSRRIQGLRPGVRVWAEGPYGALTSARRTRPDVLMVAGGVGITPIRALFETIPKDAEQDLVLLYRADRREDVVFREELDALAERRRARVVYVLGDRPDLLSADSLARLVPGLADRDVYLCGPPGMAGAVRGALGEAGVPDRHVHEERFAL